MKLTITEIKTINVTPELLAEMFWEMNSDQQASFFNHIADITNPEDWKGQVASILASLDKLGRSRIEVLKEQ